MSEERQPNLYLVTRAKEAKGARCRGILIEDMTREELVGALVEMQAMVTAGLEQSRRQVEFMLSLGRVTR